MYLIFDTETTGIPHNKTAPLTDLDNWPRLVQLAWQLHDHQGKLLSQHSYIIQPDGFDIPFKAEQIHGISTQRAQEEGEKLSEVMAAFIKDLDNTKLLIGHNIEFDINIIGAEYIRLSLKPDFFLGLERLDTGIASTEYCQLKGGIGGKLKMPRLNELHQKLFGKDIEDAHDAAYDVDATARSFFGLVGEGVIAPIDGTPIADIHYEEPSLDADKLHCGVVKQDMPHHQHEIAALCGFAQFQSLCAAFAERLLDVAVHPGLKHLQPGFMVHLGMRGNHAAIESHPGQLIHGARGSHRRVIALDPFQPALIQVTDGTQYTQ